MTIADLFHETFLALSANKVRSGLTILGIVIGIGAVIAMVAIGQGAAGSIKSSIQGLGANLLTVVPGAAQGNRGFVSTGRGAAQTLTLEDANALSAVNGVASISPELSKRFQVTATNGNNTNTTVLGAAPAYATVRNAAVSDGSFITDGQYGSLGRVAVMGATAASDLFGADSPVGKTVRINGMSFKVIGVLVAKGSSGFFNADDQIIVPLTTMQILLAKTQYVSTIALSISDPSLMTSAKDDATTLLADRHHLSVDAADFTVFSQADILGTLTQVTNSFTLFLASVAGISLLVGGIGIMNMMLTTVTERTREIGLRKAIGAKRREISAQFLTESALLTFIGGVIGIALGWIASALVTAFAGVATQVSWSSILLASGVSAAIGIIFGYYPARRAAALNPIEALRYE